MITIYQNIKAIKAPHDISIEGALKRIKEGSSKKLVESIRKESNKENRNELKQQLPCVMFSGQFRERNIASLVQHSGFICLDFDECDPEKKKSELAIDPYIFACWVSPSGNGVKALIKIPTDNHLGSFLALQEKYPNLDKACKDVSRVCYESYDESIIINEKSQIWTTTIEITHKSIEVAKPLTDNDKIYENIKSWLEKKNEYFTEGNRNNFLCRIVSACNRFGLPKGETNSRVSYDYVNGSTGFNVAEFDRVLNSVYINYSNQFGTAAFEDKEIVQKESREKIGKEILDMSIPTKDIIYVSDIEADMIEKFDNGAKHTGKTTFIPELDNHFKIAAGEVTLVHGIGNHGKSTMMNYLLLLQALNTDFRVAVFSPENYPCDDYYDDLIEMYIGKSAMKGKHQMSIEQYKEGMNFVGSNFFYLFPENDEPTLEYVMHRFNESMQKDKTNCFVIDPWNQLHHDYTERDDKYLSKQLSLLKRFAVLNKIHVFIVAHPNSRIEKTDSGNLKMPYVTELSGGMMWNNKLDNILCYHRPEYKTNPESTLCHFASQKIKKQKYNGKPGLIELHYDFAQRGFLVNGINHLVSIRNKKKSENYTNEMFGDLPRNKNFNKGLNTKSPHFTDY